jgi:hypothetical protein
MSKVIKLHKKIKKQDEKSKKMRNLCYINYKKEGKQKKALIK